MLDKKEQAHSALWRNYTPLILLWLMLSIPQPIGISTASSQLNKGEIIALSWSADNSRLAVAYWNTVEILDTASQQLILSDADQFISDIAWSPQHHQLAISSGLNEARIKIIDPSNGNVLLYLEPPRPPQGLSVTGSGEMVTAITWSPDGNYLAAGISQYSGSLAEHWTQLWDTRTGEIDAARYETSDDLAWNPLDNRLASSRIAGKARILDLDTEKQLVLEDEAVMVIAWRPDGAVLATGNEAGQVNLWDASSAELMQTLVAGQKINAIAWNPNGHQLASASGKQLDIWDIPTGQNLVSIRFDGVANTLAWSPDGSKIAYADGAILHIIDAPEE